MDRRDFIRSALAMSASAAAVKIMIDGKEVGVSELENAVEEKIPNTFTPTRPGSASTLGQVHIHNMRELWEKDPNIKFYYGTGDKKVYDELCAGLTTEEMSKVHFTYYGPPPPPQETKEAVVNKYPWEDRERPVREFDSFKDLVAGV